MTIETRHNPGEEVLIMIANGMRPSLVKTRITSISITTKDGKEPEIRYSTRQEDNGHTADRHENDVHKTKEEFIASLV